MDTRSPPLGVKPVLVQIAGGGRLEDCFMRRAFFIQVLPHADDQASPGPPVQVSLARLGPRSDPDPALTERLRAEFDRFSRGVPDRASYLASEAPAAWMGAQDLAARQHRLGRLDSFVLVDEGTEDGERVRYYRAGFAKGRAFVRICLTAAGQISGLQWWRL